MYQTTSASYFGMVRIPLKAGRLLAATDGANAPPVTVISERMAQRFWPRESPVGKRIKLGGPASKSPWMTIVGVVGDIIQNPYDRQPRRTFYVPYQQAPQTWMNIGVR